MIHSRQRFAKTSPAGLPRSAVLPGVLGEPRRAYTTAQAYDYCQQVADSHQENVPIASRFMPPGMRPHVLAIYAFFRAANDLADRDAPPAERLHDLEIWGDDLLRAFHGEADHPIFAALLDTAERYELPIVPFEQLLMAFRMDQSVTRHSTFSDLSRYCAHMCAPLGRLLLYVFGYRDPAQLHYADDMCIGLQMANFLQDLDIDFNGHRGRLYLPLEDLHHFGVTEDDLRRRQPTQAFRELMRFQVARARALLERGRPLLDRVGADLEFELLLTWNSAAAVLDKIEDVQYDVFHRRPVLHRADRAKILARSVAQRWPRFIGAPRSITPFLGWS